MKLIFLTMKCILISIIFILIVAQTFYLGRAQVTQRSDSKSEAEKQQQFVSIDFNNVDINVFIKFMSELSGTNLLWING